MKPKPTSPLDTINTRYYQLRHFDYVNYAAICRMSGGTPRFIQSDFAETNQLYDYYSRERILKHYHDSLRS